MISRIFAAAAIVACLVLYPTRVTDSRVVVPPEPAQVRVLACESFKTSLDELTRYDIDPAQQGVLIESLDGRIVAVSHNPELLLNSASVTKLATSYFALWKLGPDYQFVTRAGIRGELDPHSQTVRGDLVVYSEGDPLFRNSEARELAAQILNTDIRSVTGNLVIVGPVCLNGNYTTEKSSAQLAALFRRAGIQISGELVLEDISPMAHKPDTAPRPDSRAGAIQTVWLVEHKGIPLHQLLWHQNAHSVNVIADRLNSALGGPLAMEDFLTREVRIPADQIHLTRGSGLDDNAMTSRATIHLLKSLHGWLVGHKMTYLDILPAAGIDEGTLSDRFRSDAYRGSVIGKTGTQSSWDQGVSTLAGVINTRRGLFLFAIYNSHADIRNCRKWQDRFLESFADEMGGALAFKQEPRERADIYYSGIWQSLQSLSPRSMTQAAE
ncbi:MAG TPA: D-alanyl-D-alanine carboxypeptidase [Acidobacteriota bacterium]|jgi:D-alanyl-D-alanine carboxypeptidase/D-alanyl-D-alanine-endopeptidase (penicillin-binding protein 4)